MRKKLMSLFKKGNKGLNDETPNEQMKTEDTEEAQLQDDQVEEIKESNGTNTSEEESKDQLNLAMQ